MGVAQSGHDEPLCSVDDLIAAGRLDAPCLSLPGDAGYTILLYPYRAAPAAHAVGGRSDDQSIADDECHGRAIDTGAVIAVSRTGSRGLRYSRIQSRVFGTLRARLSGVD